MIKTKNCILCFKPATRWTGHVHYKGDKIIAGWCDHHKESDASQSKLIANCVGCFGKFWKQMGLKPMDID